MWEFLDEYYRRQKIDVNKAPEDIVGDYSLSIKDNRITLRDKDGVEVFARCHPEDVFDVGEGVREAFDKLKEKREDKIKVGDTVEVLDKGESYTILGDFFAKNDLMKYAAHYRYGVAPDNGVVGKVVFIVQDSSDGVERVGVEVESGSFYGVTECSMICNDAIYVVGMIGLRKVSDENQW